MKPRPRRRVPSTSPAAAAEKDSKHFMKAILPPPDHTKEIRIPDEFITRFGNELDNVATITVPDGLEWDMELKKCGGQIFFCNNWQQFVEYYSIYYGCYLDFKYEGNSKFNVVIYDTTSVEISYPFQTRRTNGEPNINCPSSASERSKDAANGINPKNTSFCSKVQNNYAYVPGEFAKEHLKPNVPFMLQNSQKKQWEVSGVLDRPGKPAMQITIGIRRFLRENKLLDGVICRFKLIKKKPVVVIQVTASHMAEKEVRESIHFKKAILPSPIYDKEIRIPENFITMFGNELENVATVTVPDGCDWEMDLKKCGEDVYFCNKEWQQFAEYYSLRYGCFLSFRYEGNSNFSVIIFDATSVEICYPLKTPSTSGETNTECPRPMKRSKVETSESPGKKVKSMSNYAYKRAEDAANAFNPKNPHFRSKITKGRHAYVPSIFASEYLKPNAPIKLLNSHREEWKVFGIEHNARSSTRKAKSPAMQITQGFSQFIRENDLSYGDCCVYELIEENPPVLEVTMFCVVDYWD